MEAARVLAWGPDDLEDWQAVVRTFRDGARRGLMDRRRQLGWIGRAASGAWWSGPLTRASYCVLVHIDLQSNV
jgi:hypothetical protein